MKIIKVLISFFVFALLLFSSKNVDAQESFELYSPDERTVVSISIGDQIQYAVSFNGQQVLAPSALSLKIDEVGILGETPELEDTERNSVDSVIKPVVRQKSSEIIDRYNEITLDFEADYSVVFRAYDDGIAYRFVTDLAQKQVRVNSEQLEYNFSGDYEIYYPEEESYMSHQERTYLNLKLSEISNDRFSSIPALVDVEGGPKLLISESDLKDYPGYYLQGTGGLSLTGIFPHVALEENLEGDRNLHVTERADYIAETTGSRVYPWRAIGIAEEDADLITNQLIYKLARPLEIEDPSWIKPGKVAWDWWNANNIYGVDFEAGINTETYKYYIDFASEMGLEYVILDEGWYELGDLTTQTEDIDVKEIIDYAEKKNVDIILWVIWKTLEDQWDYAFKQFEEWGVKGIKVDFMQRDDQWMVNWYWKVAEEAARREMLVDFHGSYKPSGLRRAYPNVITREDVKGMEHNKWSEDITPEHNLTLPFIRMAVGPMDYTPGAMINSTEQNYRAVFTKPMSQSTRVHELAKYVAYESPLQMLCDSPSHYYEEEKETLNYLSEVPTTWDETRVLSAQIADYLVIARRKGDVWYIGAMTDRNQRELSVNFSFLNNGNYTAEIFSDGPNAHRYASDYSYSTRQVTSGSHLDIEMVAGGGWVAVIHPAD